MEKRNVYIALHWAYILASFERRSNEMLYIEGKRQTPGSISFVPPVAGMIIGGEVIKDLIGINK